MNDSIYFDSAPSSEVKRRRIERRDTGDKRKRLVKLHWEPMFGDAVVGKIATGGVGLIE